MIYDKNFLSIMLNIMYVYMRENYDLNQNEIKTVLTITAKFRLSA